MPKRRRAAEIFADLLELSLEDRARYLDASCRGDTELRAEVESLLQVLPAAQEYFGSARSPGAEVSTDEGYGGDGASRGPGSPGVGGPAEDDRE